MWVKESSDNGGEVCFRDKDGKECETRHDEGRWKCYGTFPLRCPHYLNLSLPFSSASNASSRAKHYRLMLLSRPHIRSCLLAGETANTERDQSG